MMYRYVIGFHDSVPSGIEPDVFGVAVPMRVAGPEKRVYTRGGSVRNTPIIQKIDGSAWRGGGLSGGLGWADCVGQPAGRGRQSAAGLGGEEVMRFRPAVEGK